MYEWLKISCITICVMGWGGNAIAGVVVGGTRVIYDSVKKETSLSVKNPEKSIPYLIQSWVENSVDVDKTAPPFIITPPLFRLDVGQENILRIMRVGGSLPEDRESMFWLNVKSIPSTERSEKNQLQISVKTRIKMFYRPDKLNGNPNEAYKDLKFVRDNNKLKVSNPTPYYVSFFSVMVGSEEIKDAGTVGPFSNFSWDVPKGADGQVSWRAINDYGGTTEIATALP